MFPAARLSTTVFALAFVAYGSQAQTGGTVVGGPIGQPEDVADAIVWLIEGARNVTGETIYVDGGMHIAAPR